MEQAQKEMAEIEDKKKDNFISMANSKSKVSTNQKQQVLLFYCSDMFLLTLKDIYPRANGARYTQENSSTLWIVILDKPAEDGSLYLHHHTNTTLKTKVNS